MACTGIKKCGIVGYSSKGNGIIAGIAKEQRNYLKEHPDEDIATITLPNWGIHVKTRRQKVGKLRKRSRLVSYVLL